LYQIVKSYLAVRFEYHTQASFAAVAYAAIKEQLLYSAAHPLASALEREGELQNALGSSPDHREATAACLRKEKPVFHGR